MIKSIYFDIKDLDSVIRADKFGIKKYSFVEVIFTRQFS